MADETQLPIKVKIVNTDAIKVQLPAGDANLGPVRVKLVAQNWLYHAESNIGPDRLTTLGSQGWELVVVTGATMYFKQPSD